MDLHIRPGESMALVGATGTGKPTLTALVPRLHEVTSGRITLDGHDIPEMPRDALRALVAFQCANVGESWRDVSFAFLKAKGDAAARATDGAGGGVGGGGGAGGGGGGRAARAPEPLSRARTAILHSPLERRLPRRRPLHRRQRLLHRPRPD
ncbi:ATP-binding cassette domain-containing protein, partial [Streptomyces sp. SP17KL33]|uniref:ATP-binding cassette domain-containing protein n=1 Tax=Streptomyces sp. SP17KL33 TaxID=3002534 RepID=UPI003FCDE182